MRNIEIRSGSMELVYSNRICCFGDEINLKIGMTKNDEDTLIITFKFIYDAQVGTMKIEPSYDRKEGFLIKVINFNNPLGNGLKKPIRIAKLDDKGIYLLFGVYKMDDDTTPILDISLYMENRDE